MFMERKRPKVPNLHKLELTDHISVTGLPCTVAL